MTSRTPDPLDVEASQDGRGAPSPRVAIALTSELALGHAANVAACIAAGLAAARSGWAGRPLTDARGVATASSSHLPIAVLGCTSEQLGALLARAATGRPAGAALVVFPRYAQTMHDVDAYWEEHARRALGDEPLLGVGVIGPGKWVRSLTGSLALLGRT